MDNDMCGAQHTYCVIITSILRQNDVATSFWRSKDVIITSLTCQSATPRDSQLYWSKNPPSHPDSVEKKQCTYSFKSTHWSQYKRPLFYRRHFQINFPQMKIGVFCILIEISINFVPPGSTSEKPLSESMMIQITDVHVYMRHLASMRWWLKSLSHYNAHNSYYVNHIH